MPGFDSIAAPTEASREAMLKAGLFLGMFLAVMTWTLGQRAVFPAIATPAPVRVSFANPSKPAASSAPLEQKVESSQPPVAPKPKPKPPKKVQPRHDPAPPNPAPPVADTPEIIPATQMLDVPALPDTPPPPPQEDNPPPSAFFDKPYGDALVLAIKIDSEGNAIDVRITIPSYNAMGDLSFALAAKSIKYTNITPPVPEGQTIWIERRIEYYDALKNQLP